jgi:hypothetical protein
VLIRKASVLLAFGWLLLLGVSAQAAKIQVVVDAPAVQPVGVDLRIPQGRAAGRYDVAVLVGNRNYRVDGVPNVDFAHNDVDVLRQYLIRTMGYRPDNVIVEKDLTKGGLETLFGTQRSARGKLNRYVMPGESRVFIYYVGHGAPDPERGDSFFVPVDADPDYIVNAGYPLSVFYANLKKLPAKDLVVVLDSCFSGRTPKGLLFKNVGPGMVRVKETAAGIEQGAVFSSARANQLSTWYPKKRHSLFTYYFLKGLQGEADRNKDKRITTGEMNAYTARHVRYMAGRMAGKDQEPTLDGRKDIVLATLR